MRRILVKGPDCSIADTHVDWDESDNIKNHTHAFIDLMDLQLHAHEFAHPYFGWEESVTFPDRRDLVQFIGAGNDVVIRLPEELSPYFKGEDHDGNDEKYQANLLSWLPFGIDASDDENGDLIELVDDEWDWYFGNQFNWEIVINDIGQLQTFTWDPYLDPRPRKGGPKALRSPTKGEYGPHFDFWRIAVDNVNRAIAAEVRLIDESEDQVSPGAVYLVPEKKSQDFDGFVRQTLTHLFEFDLDSVPGWVDSYELPNHNKVEQEINDIESQISSLEDTIRNSREFRTILFDTGDSLEDTVRGVLRHMGLSVDPEKSGHRDGGIPLDSETYILEITGTDGGVSHGKISQLDRHLSDAESEGYGTNRTGLLIVNHDRKSDPEDRRLNTENFTDELDERGFKLLTTVELYKMLCAYERNELTTEDVIDIISTEDNIIQFDDDLTETTTNVLSRVDNVKRLLSGLFQD
ncbi:hypothetical protein ACFQDG_03885 [Natronoarchaeum mannanilyticum]|uniref:Restriction endonuclease n=1 Tax=Natronoarchaeum mannanilyticum TaxID=926360 RepID=A0AAV3TCA2_9EURY